MDPLWLMLHSILIAGIVLGDTATTSEPEVSTEQNSDGTIQSDVNTENYIFSTAKPSNSSRRNGSARPADDLELSENHAIVSLQYRKNNKHFCSGTLIDLNHVITAASCLMSKDTNLNADALQVMAGSRFLGENTQVSHEVRYAEHVFVPIEYDPTKRAYDIGVIRLSKPFIPSKFVYPIPLHSDVVTIKTVCTTYGWGQSNKAGLTKYYMEARNASDCARLDVNHQVLNPDIICMGPQRHLTRKNCQYDSGSGVFCDEKLSGVANGDTCGPKWLPEEYADVKHFIAFISDALAYTKPVVTTTVEPPVIPPFDYDIPNNNVAELFTILIILVLVFLIVLASVIKCCGSQRASVNLKDV